MGLGLRHPPAALHCRIVLAAADGESDNAIALQLKSNRRP